MRFLRIEAMAGAVLLLSTLMALALANSPWSASFLALWDVDAGVNLGDIAISRSVKHWINDGLMTVFFFVIALELKRELALGELRDPRAAALPIAAAIGGMVAPIGLFLLIAGGGPGASGWGVVMSTDTAFVVGCLAVLGSRIPQTLRLFLLSLAIFDDVGAILVVAVSYGDAFDWIALGAAGLGLACVVGISRLGVRSMPVYFALGGGVWLALDVSGLHPTLTGVLLGLMTPTRSWVSDNRLHAILDKIVAYPPGDHWSGDTAAREDLHRAGVATREALSPVERLEMALHPWVAFAILPLFAFANAGVPIAGAKFDPALTTAIFAAFVVGKPAGVVLFSVLAVKSRLAIQPGELSWGLLAAGGLLTGIGFTMALFISDLAFDAELLNSVKLGVLCASAVSAVLGLLMLARL
ncbi:Na+/H+ antiporter NhaA [Rhodoblastus acidophilus]|uniref:Na(+)/H(+) antiporter NhaA n=2 Tax=Rhodoblastus acidophilus TaxID=1074 RepID=A0A6N8DV15_RHOAC|nr:NhaA family Na+:H+ antiporter [Rhodoblastus acidophilus]MTV32684.1 Na+/H+ antiporter NhaA [Rhodoblastus acidophilus]